VLEAAELHALREGARSLIGVELGSRHLRCFAQYANDLLEWNRRFNLTAITEPSEMAIKHFLDSLTCLMAMGVQPAGAAIDIGTGAGFPGLPLKVVCPQLDLTLLDSSAKKLGFCRHIVDQLHLDRVSSVHGRAEEIAQLPEHRQRYDWALARAVAPLPVLVEYLLPFLRIGGKGVVQKGDSAPAEVHAAETALRMLGGRMGRLITVELPGVAETRYLVVVEKAAATPSAYPRRPGIPSKRPLGGKASMSVESPEAHAALQSSDSPET